MQDPTFPFAPIANILAALLVIATLTACWDASNRSMVMLQGWVLVYVLMVAVQTVVWRDTYENIAPALCDITSHLLLGFKMGLPASSFLVTRRLWLIVSGRLTSDNAHRWREIIIDYTVGLGLPALYTATYYIVQNARFQIIEDFGGIFAASKSGAAILLIDTPPLLFPIASALLYCWRIVLELRRHRRSVNGVFHERGAYYARLLTLGCADMILVLPKETVVFATSLSSLRTSSGVWLPFWPGWREIHRSWIPTFIPAYVWRGNSIVRFEVYWHEWVGVVFAIALFALFGLTKDVRKFYGRAFERVKRRTTVIKLRKSNRKPAALTITEPMPRVSMPLARKTSIHGIVREAEQDSLDSIESGRRGVVTVDIEIDAELRQPRPAYFVDFETIERP